MAQKIPDSIHKQRIESHKQRIESAAGRGLTLSRGLDPTSFNRTQGRIAAGMRSALGMPAT
jgi:hypothetical protein